MKIFNMFKKILKTLEIIADNGFVLQLVDAIMNLSPFGVLWQLGSQCIIGRERPVSLRSNL